LEANQEEVKEGTHLAEDRQDPLAHQEEEPLPPLVEEPEEDQEEEEEN
jgi:hypothetical protein